MYSLYHPYIFIYPYITLLKTMYFPSPRSHHVYSSSATISASKKQLNVNLLVPIFPEFRNTDYLEKPR